ncbi:MAG: extracellular solute-binding protein [Propionibacteriales bacterium]|nr:extracellular solute-binding protein [Propionibacteriales bacterium]
MMARRRTSLAVITSAAMLTLSACGGGGSTPDSASEEKPFAGETLVVGGPQANIIDTVRAGGAFDKAFKKETGATIKWIPGQAPDNLTKLISSKGSTPPFDVAFLDNVQQERAIAADVIEQIDPKKLKSTAHLPKTSGYPHPGYGPAWVVIRLGYCINTKAYKDNGITIPKNIEGWFDPKLANHIALPDPNNFYWQATMPALADHYGVSYNNPQKLINKLATIKAQEFFTSSSAAQSSLQSGNVWLAPITDGRCLGLKLGGQPVKLIPLNLNVGGKAYPYAGLVDTWDIAKGSENKELALKFIDMALSERGTMPMIEKFGYLPSRQDLLAKAKGMEDYKPLIGDFSFDQLYFPDYEKFAPHLRDWTDTWNKAFKK